MARKRTQQEGSARTPLNPRLRFMQLLWNVDHGLQSASKRLETRAGVTGPQRLVLRIVGFYPGISAGELAGVLVTHPSTLSGVVKRLAGRGFLERTPDPSDARRSQLRLTARGKSVDALRKGTVEALVQRLLDRCSASDVAAAQRVLGTLARDLERANER